MIIKFDRTPEEFYRLSRMAFEEGQLERALKYGEKALRGKGSTEYKVSLAEIFLSMGRSADAMDLALDALCHGRGMRSEIYELLIHATSDLGHLYESVYYIARKARLEGDDEALDAMDEMMEDFVSNMSETSREDDLFVVGKERRDPPRPFDLAQAAYRMHHGQYEDAIALLREVDKDSEQYVEARRMMLRAMVKSGGVKDAVATAEEIVKEDPKCAYALYVLIAHGGRKEYLPALEGVEDDRQDLYFAIAAADEAGAYDLSASLADRLIAAEPYLPEAYFVRAAALLNGGKRAASLDTLKRLFSLYSGYPSSVILKGWARMKKCTILFHDTMPAEVVALMRRYVRKNAKDSECFVHSILTDETFRFAVRRLLEYGDGEVADNVVHFLGVEDNRQVATFFSKLLLNTRVEPLLKKAILAELLSHKDKGKIWVAPAGVPIAVPCEKPSHYVLYPENLKYAYLNLYAFLSCLSDTVCADRVGAFAERLYLYVGVGRVRSETLAAAMICRLFAEGQLRAFVERMEPETACETLMQDVFAVKKIRFGEVRKWMAVLVD